MHICGLTYQCRTQSVVCVCLQVTALPAGNFWLCCFEVRLLLSDKQRGEQVLELADSSVQHVLFAFTAVLKNQTLKKDIIPNKVEVKSNMCLCVIVSLTVKLCLISHRITTLNRYTVTFVSYQRSQTKIYSHIEGKLATLLFKTASHMDVSTNFLN